MWIGLLVVLLADAAPARDGLPYADPRDVGMDARQLERIDDVVAEGLQRGRMPGCVVCIGRRGRIVFLTAYGHRQLEPEKLPMTVDTVFDLASLTKPIATATSIMLLVERGQLRLRDRVAAHIPEFGQQDKDEITVQDLLLHQGGLIPDNALDDYQDGPAEAMERIYALPLRAPPRSKFIYTDVGYIVLAELVRRKTGQDVHEFSRQHIFAPLGMTETGFLPRKELRARAAATEQREGRWMRGEVHDPRAYLLGGVAGHAGLFSTAEDLAVYAQMMLAQGSHRGARILSPRGVAVMTRSYQVSSGLRGLGWDKLSGYSSNRGELFSSRAFGHGGFTGTALWIDPQLELFVVFLSNRLHPDGKGSVNPLAGRIGTIAAAAVNGTRRAARKQAAPGAANVLTGIDVLQRDGFAQLAGQRVGLITNHTGINRDGQSTAAILHDARQVELVALFSPEHGFEGQLDQRIVADARDETTGLKIHSLYGQTRRPTAEMLAGVETLVFDIQDIGTRFYTYVSTMGEAMRAAAEHDLRFVVLDRPNPIGGLEVDGPVLDEGRQSFVGWHTLAVRHGMTVGELARLFNAELELELDLHVVQIEGWRRGDYFDATGLLWINPSPNMRSLKQAVLYPGIGLLETTNVSVGRGTDTPFEVIGAPWLDGRRLAERLNRAGLAGVRFVPIRFTPESSKFAGQECGGVNVIVVDRDRFRPLPTGLEIARQLRQLYPQQWQAAAYDRLLVDQRTLDAVLAARPVDEIVAGYRAELDEFRQRRKRFLIYPR